MPDKAQILTRTRAHRRAQLAREKEEYQEACKEWAEQGFRPEYCFHGTSLWTDYDPMCPACEADETDEEACDARAEVAVEEYMEAEAIFDQVVKHLGDDMSDPARKLRMAAMEWVFHVKNRGQVQA